MNTIIRKVELSHSRFFFQVFRKRYIYHANYANTIVHCMPYNDPTYPVVIIFYENYLLDIQWILKLKYLITYFLVKLDIDLSDTNEFYTGSCLFILVCLSYNCSKNIIKRHTRDVCDILTFKRYPVTF